MNDNLIGQRFGRLLVVAYADSRHSGRRWLCECDCGELTETYGFALKDGTTTSCGCYNDELCGALRKTHGDSASVEYKVWEGMLQRCTNPNSTNYKRYGAKGVTVDASWLEYENFLEDMGRRPTAKHTIERKKSTLGYSKENCVWATREVQNNNTSRNVKLTVTGRTQSVAQWARERGVAPEVIHKRLRLGWPVEEAVMKPVNPNYVRRCATL